MQSRPTVKIKSVVSSNMDLDSIFKFNKQQPKTESKSINTEKVQLCTICGKHPYVKPNEYTGKYPEWYDSNCEMLRDHCYLPTSDTKFINNPYLNLKFNKQYPSVNSSLQIFNSCDLHIQMIKQNIQFIENEYFTKEQEIEIINQNHNEKIKSINNNMAFTIGQKYIKIKKANKDTTKKIKEAGKTISTLRYGIILNKEQKETVLMWMTICDHFYNYCVDRYNVGDKIFHKDKKGIKKELFTHYFDHYLVPTNSDVVKYNIPICELEIMESPELIETKIFKLSKDTETETISIKSNEKLQKIKKIKPVPFDTLSDELFTFCTNLSSNYTKVENKQQTHFSMHRRDYDRNYRTIMIPKKSLTEKGIFSRILGNMSNTLNLEIKKLIQENKIQRNCRLAYDKILDKFTILVPIYNDKKIVEGREKFAALDPGVTVFQAFYGENSCGTIGEGIKDLILKFREKISKIQSILDKNKNRKGKKIKNKKKLRKRKYKLEKKLQNIVKDMHNKTALFLCKNYDKVLIPSFNTQDMVSARTLGRRVNYSLCKLSQFKFKQHIKTKSEQYGCKIYEVTEEYTSQCCGRCGKVSKHYNEREKICCICGTRINRDLNGSRNIFIRNYKNIIKERN